jgi:hypothetical protein
MPETTPDLTGANVRKPEPEGWADRVHTGLVIALVVFILCGIVLLFIHVPDFAAKDVVASLVVGACAGALIQEVLGAKEARRLAQRHNALLGRLASVTDQTLALQSEVRQLRNALIWNRCRTATELGVRAFEALLSDPPEATASATCTQLAAALGLPEGATDPIAGFATLGNKGPAIGNELYGDLRTTVRDTLGEEVAAALDLGYRLTAMSGIDRLVSPEVGSALADQNRRNLIRIGAPTWICSYFDRVVEKWIADELNHTDSRHLFELLILYCENIGSDAPLVQQWEAEMRAFV